MPIDRFAGDLLQWMSDIVAFPTSIATSSSSSSSHATSEETAEATEASERVTTPSAPATEELSENIRHIPYEHSSSERESCSWKRLTSATATSSTFFQTFESIIARNESLSRVFSLSLSLDESHL